MKAKLSALWFKSLKILKDREDVSSVTYENWIESLSPVGISDGVVYLRVPSEVHYEVVKTMHKDKIKEAICEAEGENLDVLILNVNEQTPVSLEFCVSFDGREDDAKAMEQIKTLTAHRTHLRNEIRKVNIDDDSLSTAKLKIEAITEALSELRKDVRLCDAIAERSGVMQENLTKALAEEEKIKGKENRSYEQRR